MKKKEANGLPFKILFVVIAIFILDASTIKIIPPKMYLLPPFSLVCYFFYYSVWGNLGEHSYNFIKESKFLHTNRTLEEYEKIWKFFAIFFFIIVTIACIVGLFSPIAK